MYIPAEIPTVISIGLAFHRPNRQNLLANERVSGARTSSPRSSHSHVFQKTSLQGETNLGGPLLPCKFRCIFFFEI